MKPLKILLGNNTLSSLAGSERWTETLAKQLKKVGHIVECFSPELGIIATELEKAEIPSYKDIATSGIKPFSLVLEPPRILEYDIIIANHNHIVDFLRKQFPQTPIISTIHGVLHFEDYKGKDGKPAKAPEHPALTSDVGRFIAVSEEVQDMLRKDYSLDSVIIRNFFDVDHFRAERHISPDKPKVLLLNSNYTGKNDKEIQVIREVAEHYGAKVIATGQNFTYATDMKKAIEDADVVFGMGRSVLEGVCAGRLGIVHGRWGTGGVICEENIDELRSCNFSGRNSGGKMMTAEEIICEIDKHYSDKTIGWGMNYIRQEHNVAFAADEYLRIARDLIGKKEESGETRVVKFRLRDENAPAIS